MINKVLDHRGLTSVISGHKAEDKIKDELPGSVRSQIKVFDWLNDNW